jgi:hypothetical protein
VTERRTDSNCRRTSGLIDRVVADRVTADDLNHADGCPSCTLVLARADRFDAELRKSAEGLVGERLPQGVLDPQLAPRVIAGLPTMRRAAPGIGSVFATIAVVVVAAAIALVPGGLSGASHPPASPPVAGPLFRPTVDIIRSLQANDYSCSPGHALPTTGPSPWPGEREGVLCLSPKEIESANGSIIPIEKGNGDVVEVIIKGSLFGTDTLTSRSELATLMGKLTFESISDPTRAAESGAFIERTVPELKILPTGDDSQMSFGGLRVSLRRYPGGSYILVLGPTHPG